MAVTEREAYIQSGAIARYAPELQVQSGNTSAIESKTEPSEIQPGVCNPQLLLLPEPDPVEYASSREFRQEWEKWLVQFPAFISVATATTQATEANSQAVTRGQKRKIEGEKLLGKEVAR